MTDRDRNMEDKIRQSFEEGAPKAPEGLWSKLSEELDREQIDAAVKDSFEQTEARAPEAVWENVNRQLNIDRSWTIIQRRLNWRSGKVWLLRATAVLVPLLLWWAYEQDSLLGVEAETTPPISETKQGELPQTSPPKPQAEDGVLEAKREENPAGSVAGESSSQTRAKDKGAAQDARATANSGSESLASLGQSKENPQLALSDMSEPAEEELRPTDPIFWENQAWPLRSWREGRFYLSAPEGQVISPVPNQWQAERPSRITPKQAFQLGLRLHYDRFHIDNNIKRLAADENSLFSAQDDAGLNFGMFFNYSWSRNSRLELNFLWDETFEQNYNRFGEGQYLSEQLSYRFQNWSLLYSYRWQLGPGPNATAIWFSAGPYYAPLKSVRFKSELGQSNRTERYQERYGMLLRIGQEFKTGDLSISYGLQGQFGLNNFHRGDEKLPAVFDLSRSQRLGFYLGTAYNF